MNHTFFSKNLNFLRFGVTFLLGGLIAILGATSFFVLRSNEINEFRQSFNSLSDLTAHGFHTNLQGKILMLLAMTNGYSTALSGGIYKSAIGIPPNITIKQFQSVMLPTINVMKIANIGLMPVLYEKTTKSWESYAKDNLGQLQLPDFIKNGSTGWIINDGIYEIDSTGKKISNSGHVENSLFPDLVTPVWEVAPIAKFGDKFMFNMHSESTRISEIDMVMAYKYSVLSDLVVSAGMPSSIIFAPIVSLFTSEVFAIFFATMPWDLILEDVLPSYFSGVYFVLTTSTTSYTFLIENGKATSLGTGDLHDTRYTEYKKDISSLFSDLPIALSTDYKITMYPTYGLYHKHVTSTPGIACGAVVALIVFTSMVILFYDYVIRTREKNLLEDLLFSNLKSKISHLAMIELETKSSFIRYVSHEVRNPLNIVALGLDHLKRQISEENKEAVDVIAELESATKQAVEIMDNLLTFEKLTSNILELHKVEVPLLEYIEENIKLIQIQAKNKAVHLHIVLDNSLRKGPTSIAIDKRKISKVIQNLLSNAIRFSPPGKEVVVRASLVHSGDDKNSHKSKASQRAGATPFLLRLEVIDEGPGISAENQKRLFREVVEFTPGEFHDGKGSGLSLWISHQIVARHEGVLSVQSEGLGKGTTFILELPFLDDGGENVYRQDPKNHLPHSPTVQSLSNQGLSGSMLTRVSMLSYSQKPGSHSDAMPDNVCPRPRDVFLPTSVTSKGKDRQSSYSDPVQVFIDRHSHEQDESVDTTSHNFHRTMNQNIKILVVDDVAMNRKMLTRQLEQRWEDISCAEDGKVASDMVRAAASSGEPYDIVLMDFEMPVMNGPDAAKLMRSEGYTGLIIGVTGNGLPVDIEHFIRQGADRVLLKPVSMSVLEELITVLLVAQQFPTINILKWLRDGEHKMVRYR